MIEVKFDDYYKNCARNLFQEGFSSFHVDFGDEIFIKRDLLPWDKVKFLKSLGKVKLTAHLMCSSGVHKGNVKETAKRCLEEEFETIFIHPKSFKNYNDFLIFKNDIFNNLNQKFGIVSELNEKLDQNLINHINENEIKKILQMGVPIGKGGQSFGITSIDQINHIKKLCPNVSHVELDGGLTFGIIKELNGLAIQAFSGWSLISNASPKEVSRNAIRLKELL